MLIWRVGGGEAEMWGCGIWLERVGWGGGELGGVG
jgi:hypothetical protein